MNALYRVLGISKQAFHQFMDRHLLQLEEQQQLLAVVRDIRSNPPNVLQGDLLSGAAPKYGKRPI